MTDTRFPASRDDDAEDVAWALTTGRKLWQDGERLDALVWLRRASSAATEAGEAFRAEELAHAARELREQLESGAFDSFVPPPIAPEDPAATELEAIPAAAPPEDELVDEVDVEITIDESPAPASAEPAPTASPAAVPMLADEDVEPASSIGSALLEAAASASHAIEHASSHPAETAPTGHPSPPPLPAAVVHANILDPWAEAEPRSDEAASSEPEPRAPLSSDADVVTSADAVDAIRRASEPAPAADTPPPPPSIDPREAPPAEARPQLSLDDVEVFADLPDDAREALARVARIESLAAGEEVAAAGLALVVEGEALVQPTVADATAAIVRRGGVVLTRGTLASSLSLRIVAGDAPATIALWDDATIDGALAALPWVLEELRSAADRLQALAGATLGPLGDRLDDSLRDAVLGRLEVRVLAEGDVLASEGLPVPGLAIVGAGAIECDGGDALAAGDVVFPGEVLGGDAAPSTARAGAGGAIVLFGSRALAQELLVTCPPLVEVLADN